VEGGYLHYELNATNPFNSLMPVSFANGETGWVETIAIVDDATGFAGVIFYESYDGQRWRCLGATPAGALPDLELDGVLRAANDSAAPTRVHSLQVGIIDVEASDALAQTKWVAGVTPDRHGSLEHVYGLGAGTLIDAELVTQQVPLEPGWFIRARANKITVLGEASYPSSTPLFCGRVTNASKDLENHSIAYQELEAIDIVEQLANLEIPRSLYEQAVVADNPLAYFSLEAGAGSATDVTGNGHDGEYKDNATHALGLVDGKAEGALALTADGNFARTSSLPPLDSFGFSVEFWLQTRTSVKPGLTAPLLICGGINAQELGFVCTFTNAGFIFAVDDAGVVVRGLADNKPHHIVCTFKQGTFGVWVDGVKRATSAANPATLSLWSFDFTRDLTIGYSALTAFGSSAVVPATGTIDEVAIYSYVLLPWQIKHHHVLGSLEASGVRTLANVATQMLEAAGLDESYYVVHPSGLSTIIQTAPVYEGDLWNELQALAEAYGARIHSNNLGQVTIIGSDYFPEAYVPFSDEGIGIQYLAAGFATEIDRDDIANRVTGTLAGGATVEVRDASSMARYGERAHDVGTIRGTSLGAIAAICERHLARYAMPKERFTTITMRPQAQEAAFVFLPFLKVSEACDVTYQGTTERFLIEGVSHSVGPLYWETELTLGPAPVDDFWRWNQDALDESTRWA
jgi:hypothetical protein